jgi:hypothetical protein
MRQGDTCILTRVKFEKRIHKKKKYVSELFALAGQAKGPNRSRQGSAAAEGGGGAARSTEGSVEAFSVGRPVSDVCV